MPTLVSRSPLPECSATSTFDDLVPTGSCIVDLPLMDCHTIENDVVHALQNHPDLEVEWLVAHRIAGGLCLEGVIAIASDLDLTELVREISGVDQVLNRVRVAHTC